MNLIFSVCLSVWRFKTSYLRNQHLLVTWTPIRVAPWTRYCHWGIMEGEAEGWIKSAVFHSTPTVRGHAHMWVFLMVVQGCINKLDFCSQCRCVLLREENCSICLVVTFCPELLALINLSAWPCILFQIFGSQCLFRFKPKVCMV